MRVAVIGGGAIGLGVGWRLAAAGCSVDVFDRGEAGRGASWAAGGMLAAGAEAEPGEDDLLALNLLSQRLWPGFAEELREASGVDVEMRREGTMTIGLTADDLGRLRHTQALQRAVGVETEWLSGAEARRREPFLSPNVAGALFSPGDHQVENRLVVQALRAAFLRAGGRLHERAEVTRVEVEGERLRAVHAAGERREVDAAVLAAGAWSRRVPGLPEEARPPVRPVKGQMLALGMPAGEPLLRHVVWTPGAYLIPRLDGRLLVGATVEERGFDETVTAGGLLSLLESAWRALPGVEELPVVETWVGFRPTSRDDAPVLGPSGVEGLTLATGHHRNGILLTPVTADLVSRHVLTGEVPDAIAPFGIGRFARVAA
jgi:glycine oxidase